MKKNIITIISQPKESLIVAIQRAIKNAQCNCLPVRLVFSGIEAIIEGNDSYTKHLHSMKLKAVLKELAELKG